MNLSSIFRPTRMPRAARQRWQTASTLRELGELTALWLEGQLDSQPGYAPGCGPDEETAPLVPVLAKLNRIGYLTDCSQPGWGPRPGYDGATWCQRAGVSGFAADDLAGAIATAATEAGMLVSATNVGRRRRLYDSGAITVTTRSGKSYTALGGHRPTGELEFCYKECSNAAIDAVCAAVQLTVVDPEWGARDTLWTLLDGIATMAG
ncbi:hypothetical protein [Alloactinosynnema sp. L-07]|uniref:DUF6919 domain-containing protein n=1 Tax=Alloactinosynnema sp. L-07 TaxID=1653480 RepID=UPI00065EF842|nr:hypothetical protein [Alloactinosynnema sp. L-07]CRK57081.1 hypothetical protein [Alloactinosynnema sp. L-07]